jgi:hypothetical protein
MEIPVKSLVDQMMMILISSSLKNYNMQLMVEQMVKSLPILMNTLLLENTGESYNVFMVQVPL